MSRAIFLGSFNPPHYGHTNCIKSVINSKVMKELGIEKIHVIPCWQNPNKSKSIDFWDRYKMCRFEFSGLKDCFIDDIEAQVKPKYTYELLDYFHQNKDKIISNDFWWIITEETYDELLSNKWKESEKILNKNKFIILHYGIHANWMHRSYAKAINEKRIVHVQLSETINMNIHSTNIRENFWVNAKYDTYITKDTKEYIVEHNLYK